MIKIEKIIIEASDKQKSVSHSVNNWDKKTREELKILLMNSGNWPFIHQRPYGVMANPMDTPKAIFVSNFSSKNGMFNDQIKMMKNQMKKTNIPNQHFGRNNMRRR